MIARECATSVVCNDELLNADLNATSDICGEAYYLQPHAVWGGWTTESELHTVARLSWIECLQVATMLM